MPTPVTKSPFRRELPALKCTVCGALHYATRAITEDSAAIRKGSNGEITTRCLYCGHSHRLDGKRWVRA